MATFNKKFVVKNGLQTQNIDFVSPDTTNTIQVTMLDTDTLSFSGDSGQLFSITDSLSGTIFAVNDISGVPSIEVDDDGTIRLAETFGNVLIGTATDDGTNKLQVNGSIWTSGDLIFEGSTADGFETTLTLTDPTADRTITLPNATGTVALLGTIALGTDTTGNYVATIAGTANEIEVTGSGSETAAVTIGLPNDVTVSGTLTAVTGVNTEEIWPDGAVNHMIINAGESRAYRTGQIAEVIYMNAENGIEINSSPDNWVSGWAGRNTAYINDANGNSSLPGNLIVGEDLNVDSGTLFVDASANRVGIGTTSPLYRLDVDGEISIRGGEGSDDARMYFLASDNSARFTIETDFDGVTSNDILGFRSAATDNILVLKGGGNVGIGTASPSVPLDVVGNVEISSGTLTINDADEENALRLIGSRPTIGLSDTNGASFYIHANINDFYVLTDRDGTGAYGDWETPHPLQLEADTNTGYVFGNRILTTADEGSGNGLDADTLDGNDSSAFVAVAGDTMTGDLTISKTSPVLQLTDTNTTTGSYPKIQFDTSNPQGVALEFNEFDGELPVGGYGLILGPSSNNTQFPTTGTLTFSVLGEIYAGGTTIGSLNKVFHDGYHPNADKLTTARNIALTGAVTGNANFDGSGNISITTTATSDPTLTINGDASGSATFTNLGNATLTLTIADDSHTHDGRYYTETESDSRFVNVTGDTMTGNLIVQNASITAGRTLSDTDSASFTNTGLTVSSLGVDQEAAQTNVLRLARDGTSGVIYAGLADFDLYRHTDSGVAPNVGMKIRLSTSTSSTYYDALTLESDGTIQTGSNNIFHDGYHPNADKLTTARNIALTGPVTGNANFDGSGNISIATNTDTLTASLRSHANITGGGVITFNASGYLKNSVRFIVMSNGRGSHFSTNGYFDINIPTSGTITGVGGAANKTATADGIPLSPWEALYYILPIGSSSTSVAANFRVVDYTSDLVIPDTWVLIAIRNGDSGQKCWVIGKYGLELGESVDTAVYDSVNAKNATNADTWTTGRTITLTGDVTGTSGAFDGSGNLSFATTIAANSVALGTDTTGNYVATIAGTANEIEVTGSGSETAAVTIGLPNDVTITGDLTVDTSTLHVDSTNNRVGIGTTNPSAILHADVGNSGDVFKLTRSDINNYAEFDFLGNEFNINIGDTDTAGAIAFNLLQAGTEVFTVDNSGNVGIGTTSPTTKLDVVGGAFQVKNTFPQAILTDSDSTNASDAGGAFIIRGSDNSQAARFAIPASNGKVQLESYHGDLAFYTDTSGSPVERVTIDGATGNVGIGTTSPSAALDVVGNAEINGTADVINSSGEGSLLVEGSTNAKVTLRSSNTGSNFIYFADPDDFNAGQIRYRHDTNILIFAASQEQVFQTNSAEAMRIDSSGNVGIGKSSPSVPLDVVGNIDSSGDVVSGRGSGGVALTINDGYGNANITFNHQDGTPEQNGNAARIEVNTDSTSGALMNFELLSNVTGGVSVGLTSILTLTETQVTSSKPLVVIGDMNVDSGTLFVASSTNRVGIGTTSPSVPLDVVGSVEISSGTLTINDAGGKNALRLIGTSPTIGLSDTDGDSFYIHVNANNFYVLTDRDGTGAYGAWETPHPLQLEADTNTGYVFGNRILTTADEGSGNGLDADTVDGTQLSAITHSGDSVTLTGNVTGSTTVGSDGSISISTTVADDSHNHTVVASKGILSAEDTTTRNVHATGIYTFNTNAESLGDSTPSTYWSTLAWGRGEGGSAELAASWTSGGNELWFRSLRDTTDNWWDWKKIFHDNYHPNADKLTTARTITLSGDLSGSASFDGSANITITAEVDDDSHNHIISNVDGLQTELNNKTPLDHIRSLGTTAFTGTNTTAGMMAEMESDGAFDSYSSVFKTTWSYAGNFDLSDGGTFGPVETAGMSFLTWTDNSSDTTRGNITVLAVAPNTGGSAGGVYIYNDQGSTYDPGWREVWTSRTDGSGSGLDADLLDGNHASAFVAVAGDTMTGNLVINADLTVDSGTLFVDASTNRVGIGTTSPSVALDVVGNVYATSHFAITRPTAGAIGLLRINDDTGNVGQLAATVSTGGAASDWNFQNSINNITFQNVGTVAVTNDLNVDSGTLFVDASTNRVGVRTTSPSVEFDVAGRIYADNTIQVNGDAPQFRLAESDSNFAVMRMIMAGGGGYVQVENADGTSTDGDLYLTGLNAADLNKLEVRAVTSTFNGEVGIGTTSPATDLHIVSNNQVFGAIQIDSDFPAIRLKDTNNVAGNAGGGILLVDSNNDVWGTLGSVDASGNIELKSYYGNFEVYTDNGGSPGLVPDFLIDGRNGNIGLKAAAGAAINGIDAPLTAIHIAESGGGSSTNQLFPQISLEVYDNTAGTENVAAGAGPCIDFYIPDSTSTDGLFLSELGGRIGAVKESSSDAVGDAALVFHTSGNAANPTEKMRIDHNGNVGIGGAAPTDFWSSSAIFNPLGYVGTSGSFAMSMYSNGYRNGSSGFTYLDLNGNTNTASGIDLYPTGQIDFRSGTASGTSLPVIMRIEADGDLIVDGGTLFADASTNRVGIGTTSPSEKLEVSGEALISSHLRIGGSDIYFNSTKTSGDFLRYATQNGLTYYENGAAQWRLTGNADNYINGGNLGIGTTSPSVPLDVVGDIDSSGDVVSGRGSGGVALTINDGGGNANVTFNHQDTIPEQAGNIGRIEVNTDSTTGARMRFYVSNNSTSGSTVGIGAYKLEIDTSGVDVNGTLSKNSGSFKIDHPLKPETHHLVHSFVEAPQADNIYRGRVDLINGIATINLDEAGRMTEGTFVLLNGNIQCFTSNESGWCPVRGFVNGNILTIEAQDNTCTDTISWLVIGERIDQHMIETNWTDENGRIITEPEKVIDEPE